ncbi:S8 family serine peptidase [Micromonospora okii]|uniref:S8 family serine peptidase n=1 Tax=Micromonospora okii TaxID=1182970 RepID=UPI001E2CFD48|nr:S8 family serine peptidase [Micromonospora okii]
MRQTTRRGAAIVAAALAVTISPVAASADPTPAAVPSPLPPGAGGTSPYIVTLADKPLATYAGGVAGIAATKPAEGRKVDVGTADARRYRGHLKDKQTRVARSVGAEPLRGYSVAANSFVAELTRAQAAKLMITDGVVSVVPDRLLKPTNDRNSVDFLGLSGRKGVWSTVGGPAKAGEGIVVGVIDTGIWPESASFAAEALGTKRPTKSDPYRPYRHGDVTVMNKADGDVFIGACQTGEQFAATACNEKVVGARYFGEGWMNLVPAEKRKDYVSPRDAQGHGSHTASTAAGNTAVPVTEQGVDFGKVSGVAPGASIAVYKALWQGADDDSTGGVTSDIVAAIDQAVADGVNVINYSVGGSSESSADDPTALAFLNAAAAGVFVSSSAGNSGPDPESLDNTAPWQMTVAASTVAPYPASVELGNGARFNGASTTVTAKFGPKPLITALAAKAATATDADAENCLAGSLDPAKAAGKAVVCLRGVVARPEKSAEVARAGGVAMVLANPSDQDLGADLHSVPTVHINAPDTQAVLDYAATAGAQVTLLPTGASMPYPQVAAFSSRGPSYRNPDLLKPDIAAPGVAILAAVAPPGAQGKNFDFYSGTSMAAPHIAGLAALYLGEHPKWSPARIKSAMMTTTYDTKTATGKRNKDVYAQGAGHVDPARMLKPGLVYDAAEKDWLGYLEGLGHQTGSGVKPIKGSDLNYPSIGVAELFGTRTVTRTVTAVTPGVYRAKVDLPGMKVKVSPSTLHFKKAGETKKFTVTLSLGTATADAPVTGSLTWTGAGTAVRSPILVTPQSVHAPTDVRGKGAAGSVSFEVTPALKKFPIKAYGMVAGPKVPSTISPEDIWGSQFAITPPAGTKAMELAVRPDNPEAQLGVIVVRRVNGVELLEYVSDVLSADERIVIGAPKPGVYLAIVLNFENLPGTTETPFTIQANLVSAKGGVGSLVATPQNPKVTPGVPLTVTAKWAKVPGGRHTGYVEYPNGAGTVVTVN